MTCGQHRQVALDPAVAKFCTWSTHRTASSVQVKAHDPKKSETGISTT